MIPNHCIQNNKKLTHAGGDNHLVNLAILSKTLGKCTYGRIEATGGESSHIQNAANIFAAAPDVSVAVIFSRRAVIRSKACEGSDFLAVELSELGQIGDEHSAGLRTYAGRALKDAVFVFEVVVGIDMLADKLVDFIYLEVERFEHFLDALFDFRMMYHQQAVGFLGSQVVELAASANEFCQFSGLGCRVCFRGRPDDLSEFCQHMSIDGVCLCPLAKAVGKVTDLSRIDYNDRKACIKQLGCDWFFVTACGFEDDKGNGVFFEHSTKLAMTVERVWQTGFKQFRAGSDVKGFFCDIDTDINRFRHGFLPYLQIRARRLCGTGAAQTAVRVSPTVAARITLCDGLADQVTTDLSSPAFYGSARYARLAAKRLYYGTFNHD